MNPEVILGKVSQSQRTVCDLIDFIEMESRMVVVRAWGKGSREWGVIV